MTGADSTTVATVAEELGTQMRRIPLIADVIAQTALERPELRMSTCAPICWPRPGRSRPKGCRRRSGWRRWATSGRHSPGSMRATVSCLFASNSTRRREPTCRSSNSCASHGTRSAASALGDRGHLARPGTGQHRPLRPQPPRCRGRRPRRPVLARRRHARIYDLPVMKSHPVKTHNHHQVGRLAENMAELSEKFCPETP